MPPNILCTMFYSVECGFLVMFYWENMLMQLYKC